MQHVPGQLDLDGRPVQYLCVPHAVLAGYAGKLTKAGEDRKRRRGERR